MRILPCIRMVTAVTRSIGRTSNRTILAVQVFNSAGLKFKTEVFTMLANVAWTYLMHEYYSRRSL